MIGIRFYGGSDESGEPWIIVHIKIFDYSEPDQSARFCCQAQPRFINSASSHSIIHTG